MTLFPGTNRVSQSWRDFERLAVCYDQDNLLLEIEAALAQRHLPTPHGRDVLDIGCGTGRWGRWVLRGGAATLLQLDRAYNMAARARSTLGSCDRLGTIQADIHHLPLRTATIDYLIASLCLGYIEDLQQAFRAFSPCVRPGGILYLSDLHPDSEPLGWKRTYSLPDGRCLEPPYHVHQIEDYRRCLNENGWTVRVLQEYFIDESVRSQFEHAGRMEYYERWYGAPLLVLLQAEKMNRFP